MRKASSKEQSVADQLARNKQLVLAFYHKLIGEKEFSILFHEGERDNLHISIVGGRVILVVIFDARSSLGLVRLRVKKASDELNKIFDVLMKKAQGPGGGLGGPGSPFAEITDDDIDNLFSE